MKTGSKKKNFVSLDPVKINDWVFKVSTFEGNVLVIAHNKLFQWTTTRFFDNENMAKNFVDYCVMQAENMKEK